MQIEIAHANFLSNLVFLGHKFADQGGRLGILIAIKRKVVELRYRRGVDQAQQSRVKT